VSHTHPLVDTRFLAAAGPAQADVRIADVRWSLMGPSGWEKYRQGHIPGAVFVDLDRDLSRTGGPGRHPFPATEDFARFLGRIGVGPQTHVVAYDDAGGSIAARLWFLLKVHGHERASVLDGGFQAWKAASLPVTAEEPRISPVEPPLLVLDRRRLAERAEVEATVSRQKTGGRGTILTDARAPERYRGEVEPVDPRAGHIPGAVNAPVAGNLRDGRFLPPSELRSLYERLGAGEREVIASCGSGVTACHTLLALELSGLPPGRLYVGSFSDWSSRPEAKVATGPEPGFG
jgi:thiosulfate/3-mercaptopyruvate sulfurtransferase